MNAPGQLIARARMEMGWSQEGLCRGICAVSYLSKIESGRAEPSEEILGMLLSRLGIQWSPEIEREAKELTDMALELLFSACFEELKKVFDEKDTERYRATACAAELELLSGIARGRRMPLPEATEKCMSVSALGLQRILQGRAEEAAALLGNAYACFEAGTAAYYRGEYVRAMEHLNTAYFMASEDGSVKLMLLCKLFLGASCSNRRDAEGMERHYRAARRIARALGDGESIEQMNYNIAATAIECGNYEEAYAYFSNVKDPELMSLHKLAVCCEKTGRRSEAFAALKRAEGMESDYPPTELALSLCALVRYRLEHGDYLRRSEYGKMLLSTFERCRRELSAGYACFHLPWVLEWYKSNRQYKKALDLMEEFPR